jgi:hypothetical protein
MFKSHSGRDVKHYVWHKGLLNKLENIWMQGSLLLWIKNFLTDRKQRVVIESAHSKWRTIKAGVPHGSILGHFLIYLSRTMFYYPIQRLHIPKSAE